MSGPLVTMIFAETKSWREMGRDFRVNHSKLDPTLIVASVIIVALVVAFLWFLHRMMNRQEGRRLFNNPKQLFRSLCRVHELTGGERRLLKQLARAQDVAQPAGLFLAPERFDAARESPAFQAPPQRAHLERLRAKLFAGLEAAK